MTNRQAGSDRTPWQDDLKEARDTFQRLLSTVKSFTESPPPWVHELRSAVGVLRQEGPKIAQAFAKVVESHKIVFSGLVQIGRGYYLLDKAGWLPHYTTPFEAIVRAGDDLSDVSEAVCRHYREEWSTVCEDFSTRLDTYLVDEEAKAAFQEALLAHEHGLYRASCRLLFPEVERLSRVEIDPYVGASKGASLHELQRLAGQLTPGEAGEIFAFKLYDKLTDHLYLPARTEAEVATLLLDPVPNRHAALHGIIVYSSMQNSINTLIMIDYMFQVVSAIKARGFVSKSPQNEAP